jgi:hypothetical protein
MQIEGKTIVAVRSMTQQEIEAEYWQHSRVDATVIVLSDGSIIYPSCDPEGNGPGMLFGKDPSGNTYYIYADDGES